VKVARDFGPIAKHRRAKPKQTQTTFDAQLKTSLTLKSIVICFGFFYFNIVELFREIRIVINQLSKHPKNLINDN